MKIDLAVIGQGAVTPAGANIDSLLHRKPISTLVSSLANPEQRYPVFRVDLKDTAFARWQREPRLRRVSSITYFLVEAGEQALSRLTADERKRTGLIVAFCSGCLAYSRRFFEAIIKEGKKAASPLLFPETVFNSPVSHVAATLGLEGASYALVGDEVAWIAALKTASVWLQRERIDRVLVLGAEEFDPIALDAYRSAKWIGSKSAGFGFTPSEGAAGLLVTRNKGAELPVISTAGDGFIYRSPQEALHAGERCMESVEASLPCYATAQHNWFKSIESQLIKNHLPTSVEKQPYLGDAFTASAAWNTLRALACLNEQRQGILLHLWGLNHQVGALELKLR